MDFRWLNAHCVKSQCKMETLKKLRRLAKPDDWCFSFDLQNGHHAVGIHPEYQEYMEFDVRGELFQCGALPFGWNDSLRIFVEVMKVLVECCVPQRIEGRCEGCKVAARHAARGFWSDELRHLHITRLELEAVYKTVQSFPRELTEKVPEADVADEAPNLNDIELQARYIRSEANEWADRLSRDRDLDDWRLNRRWFRWAEAEWHRHVVDWFASELSAQLPRYYAQWCDPGCEEVDSLAYSWQGDVTWVNPSWHLLGEVAHKLQEEGVQVYWPIDNAWYSGTVGSTTDGHIRVAYDDVDVSTWTGARRSTRQSVGRCLLGCPK
eukprot:gene4322-biopygen4255